MAGSGGASARQIRKLRPTQFRVHPRPEPSRFYPSFSDALADVHPSPTLKHCLGRPQLLSQPGVAPYGLDDVLRGCVSSPRHLPYPCTPVPAAPSLTLTSIESPCLSQRSKPDWGARGRFQPLLLFLSFTPVRASSRRSLQCSPPTPSQQLSLATRQQRPEMFGEDLISPKRRSRSRLLFPRPLAAQ